jgi:hypothetical protein
MSGHAEMSTSGGWSARRIGILARALGARTYLEIGVARGVTFRSVEMPERTGVDPSFRFDTRSVADDSTLLVEATSDEYFATLPVDRTFDIMFLDGLHTAEQTYRDVCHALAHAHARTVILLDDTLPSDPWSALPDRARSVRLRGYESSDGVPWHGDVYKVVAMIDAFHQELDYRTIVGSGNPQTLMWRGRRDGNGSAALTIDEIARLSYFDLLDRRELLLEASEDDALAACLTALRG